MGVATGTVVNGKVEVAGLVLPEGATVAVVVRDIEDAVPLTNEQESALLASWAEAERGETVTPEALMARLSGGT